MTDEDLRYNALAFALQNKPPYTCQSDGTYTVPNYNIVEVAETFYDFLAGVTDV